MKQTTLFCIALALLCAPASVRAGADGERNASTHTDSPLDLTDRESHWGAIPSPEDTATVALENRSRPLWEYPVLLPYVAVDYPIRWTLRGLGALYVTVDDSPIVPFISELIGPREVPWGFVANAKVSVLSGIGGGLAFYHNEFLGESNRFKLRTFYSTNNSQKYSVGILLRDGKPTQGQMGAGYRLRPSARFFGIGPNALEKNEAFYTQETAWLGASVSRRLVGSLGIEATGVYSSMGTRGPGDDGHASVTDNFEAEALPFGYNNRSQGVMASIELSFDNTTDTGRPQRGTAVNVKGSTFSGLNDDSVDIAFNALRFNVEQFIPLWHQERALALRVTTNWIENQGSDPVPFQRLLANDEPDLLRGYIDLRWRDKGIALFSAEYRWPWWASRAPYETGVHMYIFSDVGQVFDKVENIDPDDLRYSYGVGWRLLTARGFVGRFDLGWSDEDFVFRLTAEQTFQYSKGGLYNARDKSLVR